MGALEAFLSLSAEAGEEPEARKGREAKATVASAGDNRALSVMIEQELGPALIGQDCRQISKHWENLYSGVRGHYALDRGHVFPILGRRGITISAISGIDMALWDLLGQSLNAPVWQLLGGRRHETMPAYASGGWADVNNIGQQLKSYIDRGGFKAVKMRIGVADGEVRHSVERVKAAREALGEDVDLMCDAHGTYTVSEAKRFCRMVEELNIAWFEEPVTADDKKGLKGNFLRMASKDRSENIKIINSLKQILKNEK